MSIRRKPGDWISFGENSKVGSISKLKAQIQEGEPRPCALNCGDNDCKEWQLIQTEPDEKGEKHSVCGLCECQMTDVIITSDNFHKYFHDVRTNQPQKGEIIVCYTSIAELIDGLEKRNLINLLYKNDKAIAAVQVMKNLFCAAREDAIRVIREIGQDLLNGLPYEEVCKKPYKYTARLHFYTMPECMPRKEDDPNGHWSLVSLVDTQKFFTPVGKDAVMITKFVKG